MPFPDFEVGLMDIVDAARADFKLVIETVRGKDGGWVDQIKELSINGLRLDRCTGLFVKIAPDLGAVVQLEIVPTSIVVDGPFLAIQTELDLEDVFTYEELDEDESMN